jgi:predicted transcriptional regulator
MARRETKTRYFELNANEFGLIPKFFGSKKEFDFSDLETLRKILSNEKSRILFLLKTEKYGSIYDLAKKTKRDFKSVHEDLKFLEKLGFIEFHSDKTGKREKLVPVLITDKIELVINI